MSNEFSTYDDAFLSRINTRESSTLTFATVAASVSLALLALEPIAKGSPTPSWVITMVGLLFAALGFIYREVTLEFTDWREYGKLSANLRKRIETQRQILPTFVRRFSIRLFLLLPMIAWTPSLFQDVIYVYLALGIALGVSTILSLVHLRKKELSNDDHSNATTLDIKDASWTKGTSKLQITCFL
jgi:hypothetical protein